MKAFKRAKEGIKEELRKAGKRALKRTRPPSKKVQRLRKMRGMRAKVKSAIRALMRERLPRILKKTEKFMRKILSRQRGTYNKPGMSLKQAKADMLSYNIKGLKTAAEIQGRDVRKKIKKMKKAKK